MSEKIAQVTIDQVKQYSGIVSYIQQYVSLKKRGQNYIGLCPFHSEKTPSFTVSPQKRIFHCFGCHESGDLIAFSEKIDSLTFYEAIESIAQFAGISVIKEEISPNAVRKKNTQESHLLCLSIIQEFFLRTGFSSKIAQTYLSNRGLTKESIHNFNLGYCSSSKELWSYLKAKAVSDEHIKLTGLFSENKHGNYCKLQHRLIFPIPDFQNRLVGFGGRALDPNAQSAKYINSDESDVFNKRKILYGMQLAKLSIKKKGYAILVEGYMDVILCHQFGFTHTVACMGTALTSSQARLLKRVTQKVIIIFDNDLAGNTATFRSIDVLNQENIQVEVVRLPDKDPADFLLQQGADALKSAIEAAESSFMFIYLFKKQQINSEKIEEIAVLVKELVPLFLNLNDPLVKQHYIKTVAQDLNINEEVIVAKINDLLYTDIQFPEFKLQEINQTKDKYQKAEEHIISIISTNLDLRLQAKEMFSDLFIHSKQKLLCEYIVQSSALDSDLISSCPSELKNDLSHILVSGDQHSLPDKGYKNFIDCVAVLKDYKHQQNQNVLKQKIKELEASGNETELDGVLAELDRLKKGGLNDNNNR